MVQGALKKSKPAKSKPVTQSGRVAKKGAHLRIPPKRPSVAAAVAQNKKAQAAITQAMEESAAKQAAGTGKLTILKSIANKAIAKDGKGGKGGKDGKKKGK
ncbi:hypothetical protein M427DRAFT_160030 [Gonapodya prolifera JEL478]|uniref:Uncharacterized protein n=1 Tax=Gonapodya prolifera (strain JEL478) TaxID=1344416 RepID=A0A138ZZI2_GONPJ|nr:hypothetical protein M427DRAFT_160030 [Gonapodya prolifera JEL478]|eukprot:KXS09922.1 hypothetical protein M427DRAFT_160030 [Gonapodya prolifera JEL478]